MNYFFDIGANSGQAFDFHLLKTPAYDGWEVFLFEPSPRTFASLLVKAKEMSTRYRVTVLPFAIAGTGGTRKFYESEDSECDTLQPFSIHNEIWNHPNTKAGYGIVVATVSLSHFILEHTKPEDRIVIKLDAEGAEYGIVHDLLTSPSALARVKEMFIEWHWVDKDKSAERDAEKYMMAALRKAGCDAKIWEY